MAVASVSVKRGGTGDDEDEAAEEAAADEAAAGEDEAGDED